MAVAYYESLFAISLLLSLIYFYIWNKHFDVHITLMFGLVPIANLGYVLLAKARSLETAIVVNKLTYIGGCYLMLDITLCVFSMCKIKLVQWLKGLFFILSTLVYFSIMTIGENTLFYKEATFKVIDGAGVLVKKYGIMHHVFYAMIILYFAMGFGAMIYSYFKKNQVSRNMIHLLFMTEAVAAASFFGLRNTFTTVEIIPAAYVVSQLAYILIIYRTCLYDISDTAVESLVQSGDTGLVSFDFSGNYLGSNETAKKAFPELNELTVDETAALNLYIRETMLQWLRDFSKDEKKDTVIYERRGKTYIVNITYLFDGRQKRGYQFFIKDDTKNQEYIKLINNFNNELQKEVELKTDHIIEMQDNLVLGMATMVEGRDNSTGGHIKRTSECVRMLVDEMKKDNAYNITDDFCKKVIKAAPMHDLGKITVDDAILRKPGKLTDEEYAKMKTHAAQGARIVHDILMGTDDDEFRVIAENVAHYHHERWDGRGYPDGLKGEEIPLEARIMAIADVYDALVSKRAYKESMPITEINKLILDGMGTQFDKGLEPYYKKARPKLEKYYRKQKNREEYLKFSRSRQVENEE